MFSARGWDVLMGMVCISVLLLMRRINIPKTTKYGKVLTETMRMIVAGMLLLRKALVTLDHSRFLSK